MAIALVSTPFGDPLLVSTSPVAPDIDIDSFVIAFHKSKHTCTSHHLFHSGHLSPSLRAFTIFVATTCVPKSILEVLYVPCWRQVMLDEMTALHDNGIW